MSKGSSIFGYCRWVLVVFTCFAPAFAQVSTNTTGQIHGTVTDSSGGLVPGAKLVAKDTTTGLEVTATSEKDGNYTLLQLQPGAYDLTITMTGFQRAVYTGIVVNASRITDQPVQLTLGSVTNTIEVTGVAPVLETSSSQISTTVENKNIQDLPFNGRETLPFATLMAGSQQVGINEAAPRTGTFNGLPNASMNISLDGMNNNSQRFRSGGTSFFGFAPARLDAIQEITVTTTGSGADASGDGAMQIQLVTKRGTDQYHFKVFEQFRNDDLNANSFFNNARGLPRTKLRQNDFGGNLGGPLPIPFVPYFKHRLFFFVNFEAVPIPSSTVGLATMLTPQAQSGNFSYVGTDNQVHAVNLLSLAAARGYSGAVDPSVAGILNTINSTTSKGIVTPNSTDLIRQTLQWNQAAANTTYYPTARVDYQIAPKVAWHGSWNLRHNTVAGAPQYPGLTPLGGSYKITTYVASNTVDWTITPSMLNSATFGVQSNGEYFYKETDVTQWAPWNNRYIQLWPMTGIGTQLTPLIPNQTPFIRNNPVYQFRDNLSWLRGKHSITFGVSWLHTSFYETNWNAPGGGGVTTLTLGVDPSDPINGIFTAANFPSIRSTDLGTAAQLYAALTGRLGSPTGTAPISGGLNVNETSHQYVPFAPITQRFAYTTSGLFAQDAFHITPRLTLNYGLRWQFTTPVRNTNGIDFAPDYANFFGPSPGPFAPGVLTGPQNPVITLQPATYSGTYKQPAPNFGFAWNPGYEHGWLGALLGHGTVIRGSYAINFYSEGMNAISNVMSMNQGSMQSLSLSAGQPGFPPGGLTVSSPMPPITGLPASFTTTLPQSYFTFARDLYTVNPNLRSPYVQNWNFGLQRALSKTTVLEVRYVGNKATHVWHYYNTQETNIFENGFLQEFKNAQKNLAVNQAAGVTSFANRGLSGQAPLPILETAFGARGSQPALPAGFTNGTFITNLQQGQAGAFAQSLATTVAYYCRLVGNTFSPCTGNGYSAPGPYPINFFQPNPFSRALNYQDDNGNTNYNGLQIEARKSMSHGLSFGANYTLSHTLGNIFNYNNQTATSQERTVRNSHLDYGPTPFDLRHVFQAYWTYSLPGRGLLLGGWTLSGIHRITSGHVFQLTTGYQTMNNLGDTGTVLNGLTAQQLQGMFNTFSDSATRGVLNFVRPSLIGSDGRANPQFVSPNTTPGAFGAFVYLYGPSVFSTDLALLKEIPIKERLRFGFQVEALNAFNHPVFSDVAATNGVTATTVNVTSATFGQTNTLLIGPRQLQLRAYLQW
jgi:hypothetical protein